MYSGVEAPFLRWRNCMRHKLKQIAKVEKMKPRIEFFFMWGVSAMLLAGCHSEVPLTIEPIPPQYKTEAELPAESTPTVKSMRPVSRSISPSQPSPRKQECGPARWRHLDNPVIQVPENWRLNVSWGLIKAGEATLAVESLELIRGRAAYHVSMDLHATGMTEKLHPFRDRTDAWLDKESFTTVLWRHSVREKNYQADEMALLDPLCQRFDKQKRRLDRAQINTQSGSLLPDTLDLTGALFYLRTLTLAPGKTYELNLFIGEKAVPATAHVGALETLKVGAGTFSCYTIDFKTEDPTARKKVQQLRWWISADERRLPVRIRMDIGVGHITAELQK
jgi:hypothetical protein